MWGLGGIPGRGFKGERTLKYGSLSFLQSLLYSQASEVRGSGSLICFHLRFDRHSITRAVELNSYLCNVHAPNWNNAHSSPQINVPVPLS